MNRILVEQDHFLKILSVILDPNTPEPHRQAVQRFFAHDVPDFLGWCETFRPRISHAFPSEVVYAEGEDELRAKIGSAKALVTESLRVDAMLLAQAPELRLVQKFGTILTNVDLEACADRGVAVEFLRRTGNIAVAEQAFALIMALCKRICELDHCVDEASLATRGYTFRPRSPFIGYSNPAGIPGLGSLFDAKLGILGFGEVGREIARFAQAFGMRIGYHQRRRLSSDDERSYSASYEDLPTLASTSDYLVVQLPLNESTRGIIDRDVLGWMKPGAYLINVARAELVDREALVDAVKSRRLAGLGFDVGYSEPAELDDPLLGLRDGNVILMPHTAIGARQNALRDMETLCLNINRRLER